MGMLNDVPQMPQQAAAPPGPPTAPQQAGPPPMEGPGPGDVTDDEQDLYWMVVSQAMEILYDDGMLAVAKELENSTQPEEEIGILVANTILMIEQAAEQNGAQIPPIVLFKAVWEEIVPNFGEWGETAGLIVDEGDTGDYLEVIFYSAVKEYTERAQLTDEERAEAVAAMDQIQNEINQTGGDAQMAINDTFGIVPQEAGVA